jgi:uncharacterized protein YecT (DUF1311 family)
LDRKIDARVKQIWLLLASKVDRESFVRGERSWLVYRRSGCSALASKYAGGSEQPVAFAECEVLRNRNHLKELGGLLAVLHQH